MIWSHRGIRREEGRRWGVGTGIQTSQEKHTTRAREAPVAIGHGEMKSAWQELRSEGMITEGRCLQILSVSWWWSKPGAWEAKPHWRPRKGRAGWLLLVLTEILIFFLLLLLFPLPLRPWWLCLLSVFRISCANCYVEYWGGREKIPFCVYN